LNRIKGWSEMVDDALAAAVACLVFLLGLIAWTQISGVSPVTVPASVSAMAVISLAITSLVIYGRMNRHR